LTQDTPALAPDPNLGLEEQQAQSDLVNSLQQKTSGDMASLMARYGTHLALAGVGPTAGSPVMPLTGKT
jgi:hypothetical protein